MAGSQKAEGKSGVGSSFLPEKGEIRCRFIILARKDDPTPDYVRFWDGHSVGELARVSGVSQERLRTRKSRALHKLRVYLEECV